MEIKVSKDLKKILGKREVLILENDSSLIDSILHFRDWMVENKIKHNTIYRIDELPLDYIKRNIEWYDTIAFMSTFTYPIVQTLVEYVCYLKEPKTIIECYVHKPGFAFKPKDGRHHDVYVLDSNSEECSEWELTKLTNKLNTRLI